MKIDLLSNAGREIAQWRQYFRTHGAAALRTPFRRSHADTDLDTTDWPETEWSETSPDTLALSGPIDPTETQR
jgi:hypothetical protein